MDGSFALSALGSLTFGAGTLDRLGGLLVSQHYGKVALVTSRTFSSTRRCDELLRDLHARSILCSVHPVSGEPSVTSVDSIARSVHGDASDVVVGIGGGSALDTAKAVAAMAPLWAVGPRSDTVSVRRYLEGVGDLAPPPHRLPLIAIPTTAGTGSEATKNAVIAEIGPDGFKKSLRHDAYVPDHVIIDPTLAIGLPRQISSASALDALTQLLEAYTSINANPYIDALALDAIGRVGNALRAFLEKGEDSVPLRSELAYGAYISGIALANAGLGYVHAIAGPLGALHHAPHGVICANLIEPVNRAMMEVARDTVFLEKMERVSRLWGEGVVDRLGRLVRLAGLPRLGTFGYTAAELAAIGEKATGRTSPVTLKSEDIVRILHGLY